ncbi:hypothetical protein V8C34DRAFT_303014 [Trichoderma compactum]
MYFSNVPVAVLAALVGSAAANPIPVKASTPQGVDTAEIFARNAPTPNGVDAAETFARNGAPTPKGVDTADIFARNAPTPKGSLHISDLTLKFNYGKDNEGNIRYKYIDAYGPAMTKALARFAPRYDPITYLLVGTYTIRNADNLSLYALAR